MAAHLKGSRARALIFLYDSPLLRRRGLQLWEVVSPAILELPAGRSPFHIILSVGCKGPTAKLLSAKVAHLPSLLQYMKTRLLMSVKVQRTHL